MSGYPRNIESSHNFSSINMLYPNPSFVEFQRQDVEQSIADRFQQQVKQFPQKIAIIGKDQQFTYEQLDRLSNRISAAISAHIGQQANAVIGLLFEQDVMAIAAIIGASKSGQTWVPLDSSLPHGRLNYMLEDSQASLIITDHKNVALAKNLAQHSCQWFNIEAGLEQYSNEAQNCSITSNHLAYILYTSGSTGQPKGVVHNHRNILHNIRVHTNSLYISPNDRLSWLSTYSHTAGLTAIFRALLNGATVLPFNLKQHGVGTLANWLINQEITLYHSVPTVFRHFLHTLSGREVFPQLRLIHLGGEPVSSQDVALYKKHFPKDCVLLHNLGSTEVGTYGQYLINQQTQIEDSVVPLVCDVEGKEMILLDEADSPVSHGCVGEIAIKSRYIALGYWQQPELTQAKFHETAEDDGVRLYRTGDLGRLLPDGRLEYLGRKDSQVKVRGQRIDVTEIEVCLLQHPDIKEAAVSTQDNQFGDKQLLAYVVPQPDRQPAAQELRQLLQLTLPDYMIPSAVIWLDALPLTPNGKIDRRALPRPNSIDMPPPNANATPGTELEQQLVDIWAEVLKLKQVGIHDNFFELGGHSLLAAQVMSRIRDALSVELSLDALFKSPTIAKLAAVIEQSSSARKLAALSPEQLIELKSRLNQRLLDGEISPTAHHGDSDPAPLSFTQQRLWFLHQLEPDSPAYHMTRTLRLHGPLNVVALQRSLTSILERHESLRTHFVATGGVPIQVIAPASAFEMLLIDLTTEATAPPEARLTALLEQYTKQAFDLSTDLMLRTTLFRLGDQTHVLQIVVHHIASDGWSMGILTRELGQLYQAYVSGQPNPLPELPIQYADFAHWQRQWLSSQVLETYLSYWQQQLTGAPSLLELPTDYPRPPQPSYRGATLSFSVNQTLTNALKQLSQQNSTTLFMTLLAAFKTLLYRYTQQDDIVIGSPIANRNRTELEGLIGFFANTLALRTDLSGQPSFRQLLTRMRQVALDAYSYQDMPFEKLVEELQPERNLGYSPIFQVMFVLQNTPQSMQQLADLQIQPEPIKSTTAKFDLTLSISEGADALTGNLEYSTDLFEAATIERMVGHFQTLLASIVANPDMAIATLPILTEAEQYQLLVEWTNQTQTEPIKNQCIHELFEEQASRTPSVTAVVFEDQQLTYQELNTRANQLAYYLQSLGVGPDQLVGICIDRSCEMIIGLLAILKAGGAYLPLDPNYPQARLDFMLENAQATVILTQQSLKSIVATDTATIVCIDTDWSTLIQQPCPLDKRASQDNLAYVIYTSGSTGQPKGILLNHRPLVNLLLWQLDQSRVGLGSKTLQFSPISFDVSFQEIFSTLLAGATLVLIKDEQRKDAIALLQIINDAAIERLFLPFIALQNLTEVAERRNYFCPSIKEIITAGEQLQITTAIATWFRRHPNCALHNHYGPSESHVVTSYSLTGDPQNWPTLPPIGRSLPHTQLFLLDTHYQPVPIGVTGELFIGVDEQLRGYINRPDLTNERFIAHPFRQNVGKRLYRTGDLGRYLPDGNLEFLGRVDHQVKIRGFRIEVGEVEAALSQHPLLQQVAVIVREDTPGDKRLVAYIVAKTDAWPTTGEWRQFLLKMLPDYMIPAAFVQLELLPLTPNGKVDRRALPAPQQETNINPSKTKPRNDIEQQLVQIWESCLGIQPIGIQDNFFDLGGHSLLAMKLLAEMERMNLSFPLNQLFQAPTIEAIAKTLTAQKQHAQSSCIVPLKPGSNDAPLFLIHAGGASVLFYQPLAQHMQTDQAVYAIQSAFLTNPNSQITRIEQLAQYYLQEIKMIQPHGPYFIGGASFGGIVAYEMAQQLSRESVLIGALILLDRAAPRGRYRLSSTKQRYHKYWNTLLKTGPTYLSSKIKNRLTYERQQFEHNQKRRKILRSKRSGLPLDKNRRR